MVGCRGGRRHAAELRKGLGDRRTKMFQTATANLKSRITVSVAPAIVCDPLDEDVESDATYLVSERSLVRLALVASEVGARFQRDGVKHDPMAWMLAPRRMFDGRPAITACLDLEDCTRAILLHGLSLGLDAAPEDLDALAADDVSDDDVVVPWAVSDEGADLSHRQLYTATYVERTNSGTKHGFSAVMAQSEHAASRQLAARMAFDDVHSLNLIEGFDAALPLVNALVSPRMAQMLEQIASDPGSPLADGLEVIIEQRLAA